MKLAIAIVFIGFASFSMNVSADDTRYQSDAAVADILFNYDGSEEFASYAVRDDGFVDITFAQNIPDELYGGILTELKSDKRIRGVLSGKTGPVCVFSNYK